MYATFSIEPSYGADATTQDYVVDLISDEILENINYVKTSGFNSPTVVDRYPAIRTVGGRMGLEMTTGNLAWNVLFQALIGQKVNASGVAFAPSSEKWKIVTGMLSADLDASDTTFTITEYKTGEFDNVDGIIINAEYVTIASISDGVVSGSTRGQKGSTAASHTQNNIVYGVVNSGGNSIDIISRYRNGFSYSLPTSLTWLIYRAGDYFKFNGVQFSDLVFNVNPQEGVSTSFALRGKNSGPITLASYSSAADDNPMIDTDNMCCYSMGVELDATKFYFQISNTLTQNSSKFMDSTYLGIVLNNIATYGQFTALESSLDHYNSYVNDDIKNISLNIFDGKSFTKAFVFAFNQVRWGTMQHMSRTTLMIQDSIPFYTYGAENFTVLIQN